MNYNILYRCYSFLELKRRTIISAILCIAWISCFASFYLKVNEIGIMVPLSLFRLRRNDPMSTLNVKSNKDTKYLNSSIFNLHQITSESALLLYQEKIKGMAGKYTEVTTFNAGPVSYDDSMRNDSIQIDGIPTREPETYTEFSYWLPKSKYYVGFGTWIGVTIFYAAQMVEKAVGFEGDPSAYASVFTNLEGNTHRTWYNHTYIYPVAVREGYAESVPKKVSMRSDKAGNSCSGMNEIRRRKDNACGNDMNKVSWDIDGYTLSHLLQISQIPVSKETFIKIDIESYECELLPSWLDWLRDSYDKPTLFISFHGYVRCCTSGQYSKILKLAKLYATVNDLPRNLKKVKPENYFTNSKCNHCACPRETLIFSDINEDK